MWLLPRWLKSGLFLLFQFFYHTLFGFETTFSLDRFHWSKIFNFWPDRFDWSKKNWGWSTFKFFFSSAQLLVAYFRGLAAFKPLEAVA
jgi:hypothetical protein